MATISGPVSAGTYQTQQLPFARLKSPIHSKLYLFISDIYNEVSIERNTHFIFKRQWSVKTTAHGGEVVWHCRPPLNRSLVSSKLFNIKYKPNPSQSLPESKFDHRKISMVRIVCFYLLIPFHHYLMTRVYIDTGIHTSLWFEEENNAFCFLLSLILLKRRHWALCPFNQPSSKQASNFGFMW